MTTMRSLRAIGWTLLPVSASVGLGCSSGASEASDAGQRADAAEPGVDASDASVEQPTDATGPGVDASDASVDAGGQDGAPADGGTRTGSSSTIPWNGGNFYLYGVNYPWLTYGTDFGDGGFGHLANPNQVNADIWLPSRMKGATFCACGSGWTPAMTRSSAATAR